MITNLLGLSGQTKMKSKMHMVAGSSTEQWVSVEQVAQHLKIKPDTVYKWLERKDMPAHKVGRLWRFKISEVDAWIRSDGAMPTNKDLGRKG